MSLLKVFIGLFLVYALFLLIKELRKCNKKFKAEETLGEAQIDSEVVDLEIAAKKEREKQQKKRERFGL
jgi:glutaredoxin